LIGLIFYMDIILITSLLIILIGADDFSFWYLSILILFYACWAWFIAYFFTPRLTATLIYARRAAPLYWLHIKYIIKKLTKYAKKRDFITTPGLNSWLKGTSRTGQPDRYFLGLVSNTISVIANLLALFAEYSAATLAIQTNRDA
jgi:hypothetical protein